jgi:hypothetical protein
MGSIPVVVNYKLDLKQNKLNESWLSSREFSPVLTK